MLIDICVYLVCACIRYTFMRGAAIVSLNPNTVKNPVPDPSDVIEIDLNVFTASLIAIGFIFLLKEVVRGMNSSRQWFFLQ